MSTGTYHPFAMPRLLALLLVLTVALAPFTVWAEDAPAEESTEAPADEAPADEAPSDEAPADEAPADDAPSDETPVDDAPAAEAPADEPPADETPADEPPPAEAPAAEAPAVEPPPAPAPAATASATPRTDDLGRPFPDPMLLRRAKGWTAGGIALSAVGGGLMVTGLFVGSAMARGEIEVLDGRRAGAGVGILFGGGALMMGTGIPLASAGGFTAKQLNRTIKGAPKVPRTVANDGRYWNAYLERQIGQSLSVIGGGTMLAGVVVIAGVVATIDTEYYRPVEMWLGVAGTFTGGAAVLILGVLLQKDADKKMTSIKKEVDPYYQEAALPPRLRPIRIDPRELIPLPTGTGIRWGFHF